MEVHVPPFDAAVAAGVATIMPAFTDLDGVPMTANKELLRHHLRDQLGFDGVIVSDYNAIARTDASRHCRGPAGGGGTGTQCGVDIDMMADAYRQGLPVALERGLVTMAQIDESVSASAAVEGAPGVV